MNLNMSSPQEFYAQQQLTAGGKNDWTCPTCSQVVFASKVACFRCHTPKPGFLVQNEKEKQKNSDYFCDVEIL